MARLTVPLCITTVFITCCFNVYLLEHITRKAPGAGNLVTFAQFLFISVEGFLFGSNCCTKRRSVPLNDYLYLVITFFLVSVSNNWALNFNISMPLHMIFKSGSLIANMMLGILILNNRYKLRKYISVGMITVGIALCTIASAQHLDTLRHTTKSDGVFLKWLWGIFLLTFSLIASARMGIFQETIHRRYGRNIREALFYCHALPLPGFILLYQEIISQAVVFSTSEPMEWAFGLPRLWVFLLLNAVTQYFCARSVFTLTSECSSLVVTLVITLRKFLSLLISIYYFENPFTVYHWMGTLLVFLGTMTFVDIDYPVPKFLMRFLNRRSESDLSSLNTPTGDSLTEGKKDD